MKEIYSEKAGKWIFEDDDALSVKLTKGCRCGCRNNRVSDTVYGHSNDHPTPFCACSCRGSGPFSQFDSNIGDLPRRG